MRWMCVLNFEGLPKVELPMLAESFEKAENKLKGILKTIVIAPKSTLIYCDEPYKIEVENILKPINN